MACPRLTELTLIYPHPDGPPLTPGKGIPTDVVGTARSVTPELVNACKALPDFDTLQIVHLLLNTPPSTCTEWWMRSDRLSALNRRRRTLREQVEGVKDLAVDCLEKSTPGRLEGEGRKRVTLRVVELTPCPHVGTDYPEYATIKKVEVYEGI